MKKIKRTQCSVPNCLNKGRIKNKPGGYQNWFCSKHYQQYRKWILWIPTRYDHRPAIIEWSIAKIALGFGAKDWYTVVDKEFARLDKYRRYKNNKGYASYLSSNNTMHTIVMEHIDKSRNSVVDHINRDKLDNRKCNLRITTPIVNARNSWLRSNNKSGCQWVYKRGNNYVAQIRVAGKSYTKNCKSIEEAVIARKEFENKYREH